MADQARKSYQFGDFRLDPVSLRLEFAGQHVQLPHKSLETLKVLIEEKGTTVSRETLLNKIWPESYVEDANLTVAVSTLRKTLASYAEDDFIQTVPRHGYRFVAEAIEREGVPPGEEPIVLGRHTVEQLTVERSFDGPVNPSFRFAYPLAAIAALLAIVGSFAAWQGGGTNAFGAGVFDEAALAAFEKGDALMQKRLTVCDSISYFREAIAKDDTFGAAHANLAAALIMCGDPGAEAEGLIRKSLSLDPDSADAHAVDGFNKMFVHWDWDGAETALRRAVVLDPASAKSHHWLAVLLSIRGRFLEARGEMARAIELNPSSPLYQADLCQINYFERDVVRAITECRRAFEIDPNFLFTPGYLRDAYLLAGDQEKAWENEVIHLTISKNPPDAIAAKEEVFRRSGFEGLYRDVIRHDLQRMDSGELDAQGRHHLALNLGVHYAFLRDRESALYWLEQGFDYDKRPYPFGAAYLAVEPRFAFLRSDARFQAILQKMNLAPLAD